MKLVLSRSALCDSIGRIIVAFRKQPDAFTRSILFFDDKAYGWSLFANTVDSHFKIPLCVMNESEHIERPFALEAKPFLNLLKSSSDEFVTIHDEDRKLSIRILNGTVGLENMMRMVPRIRDEVFWKESPYPFQDGNVSSLNRVLRVAGKAMSMAPAPEYKRISIQDGTALLNFGNSALRIDGVFSPNLGIRSVDIPLLRNGMSGDVFSMQTRMKEYLFMNEGMLFSIPTIKHSDLSSIARVFDDKDLKYLLNVPLSSIKECAKAIGGSCNNTDTVLMDVRSRTLLLESSTKTGRKLSFPVLFDVPSFFTMRSSVEFFKKCIDFFLFVSKIEDDNTLCFRIDNKNKVSVSCGKVYLYSGVAS